MSDEMACSFFLILSNDNIICYGFLVAGKVQNKHLNAELLAIGRLTPSDRDAMWAVFCDYYENVKRDGFEHDLAAKDEVILLRDRDENTIQGFSTLHFSKRLHEGVPVAVIFSGDTVIRREYWGQTALQWQFFRYIVRKKLQHPRHRIYWFLISKGYKTYLLLTRNFPVHWPRYDRPTPPWETGLLDRLAQERFGTAWDPVAGVLRLAGKKDFLKEQVAPIGRELLEFPDIRFFQEKNPRNGEGDELCCLGGVDLELGWYYTAKIVRRLLRKRR